MAAAHEAAMVQEELQQIQVWVTQVSSPVQATLKPAASAAARSAA